MRSVTGCLPRIDDHVDYLRLEGLVPEGQGLRVAQVRLVQHVAAVTDA
jgi:hypothetical protein